jgi:hypothetical protein
MPWKLILAIIVILLVLMMFWPSLLIMSKTSKFTQPVVQQPNRPSKLVCNSPEVISATKNYYDKVGEYHDVFTMDPISSSQLSDTTCAVKYQYIPTPLSPRNDSEVDARVFTYRDSPEGWRPVLMSTWKSGYVG